jgi:alkylated DNA repair protein alkB family protein 6
VASALAREAEDGGGGDAMRPPPPPPSPLASSPPLSLAEHAVGGLPSISYVPDYLSADQEAALMAAATRGGAGARWTVVSGRRLQAHGGAIGPKGSLIATPLPAWLAPLAARLARETGAFGGGAPPNHVLVNAYLPGEGIMVRRPSGAVLRLLAS